MSVLTLKRFMDEFFKDVVFDEVLADRLYKFQVGFISRNLEHINFFGGNLLGVNVIRFKDSDVEMFLEEILNVDTATLYSEIKKVKTIIHKFKVAGDPFNLVLVYLVHRWLNVKKTNTLNSERAAFDTLMIFFYRTFCALNNYYFRYPVSENLAKTVYEKLSGKYLIKKYGTWGKVCEYRVSSALDSKNKQVKVLTEFTDDYQIQQILSDYQGRIRDMYKNFYQELVKLQHSHEVMQSKSNTVLDANGEETLGDIVDTGEILVNRVKGLLHSRDSFLKPEVLDIIAGINKNTNRNHLEKSLIWLQSNFMDARYFKAIGEYVELSIVYCLNTIHSVIGKNRMRDLPYVIVRLKNVLSASKVSDDDLKRVRTLSQEFVTHAIGDKGGLIVSSTATAMTLYMVILVLSKQNA